MSKVTDVNAYSNENIRQNEKVSFVIHKILNRREILPGELDLLRQG